MRYFKDKDLELFGRAALSSHEDTLVRTREWVEISLEEVDEINRLKEQEYEANTTDDEKIELLYSELSQIRSRLDLAELISDIIIISELSERIAEVSGEIKAIRSRLS